MWAAWLDAQLVSRGWRQADLVLASKGTITRDRVSKWLSGNDGPSYKSAIVVANVLGLHQNEALEAAGFMASQDSAAKARQQYEEIKSLKNSKPARSNRRDLKKFSDSELLEELLRRSRKHNPSDKEI